MIRLRSLARASRLIMGIASPLTLYTLQLVKLKETKNGHAIFLLWESRRNIHSMRYSGVVIQGDYDAMMGQTVDYPFQPYEIIPAIILQHSYPLALVVAHESTTSSLNWKT